MEAFLWVSTPESCVSSAYRIGVCQRRDSNKAGMSFPKNAALRVMRRDQICQQTIELPRRAP